ncbi:hypothetical protein AVEN_255754-1, partial [Araneus ventricosus]
MPLRFLKKVACRLSGRMTLLVPKDYISLRMRWCLTIRIERTLSQNKFIKPLLFYLSIYGLLVSLLGWNHVQLDVKSAYLYGKLNEKVYLKQPPGFTVKDAENKVYLLHKALYGLHQSGRSWNCELDHILEDLKFDKLLWSN